MVELYRGNMKRFMQCDHKGFCARLDRLVAALCSCAEDIVVIVAHSHLIGNLTTRLGIRGDARSFGACSAVSSVCSTALASWYLAVHLCCCYCPLSYHTFWFLSHSLSLLVVSNLVKILSSHNQVPCCPLPAKCGRAESC